MFEHTRRLVAWLALSFFFAISPGIVEAQVADVHVAGGYSRLTRETFYGIDRDDNRGYNGWYASATKDINDWLGVIIEGGGEYHTERRFRATVDRQIHSLVGGLKWTWHNRSIVSPFARVLFGIAHATAQLSSDVRPPAPQDRDSSNYLLTEMGGGVTIRLARRLGLEAHVDYRRTHGRDHQLRLLSGLVIGLD